MTQQHFIKEYPDLPAEAVTQLFHKYKRVEEIAAAIPDLCVPRALHHTKTSITFTYIDFSQWVSLRTGVSPKLMPALQTKVGAQLAHLHHGLQQTNYIHGDLWPGNIFYTPEKQTLLWIDFEPVHNRPDWQAAIVGAPEQDLAQWIALSETLYPIAQWYTYPLNRRAWYDAFLSAYTRAGGVYDPESLAQRTHRLFANNIKKMYRKKMYSIPRRIAAITYRYLTKWWNPYLRSSRPYYEQKDGVS